MGEEQKPDPVLPTVDEEMAATKTVLDALLKLPNKEAQARVIGHAAWYLGTSQFRW